MQPQKRLLCLPSGMDKVIFLGLCFVLSCWSSLQVTLCYLASHLRLPHVPCQCLSKSFIKPVCIRFWSMKQWTSVLCDWFVSSFRVDLACVTAGTLPPEAAAVERAGQTEVFLMALCPHGCCGISVIELVILYFLYLHIHNFQIYCSEETHLVIHVLRWKLSGFYWFPVCLWEVPELSGRCLGSGRANITHPVNPLVDTYINSSLQTPGNSSAGFCFQFAAESGTWLSLPNRFIDLFHFLDTLYSASRHIFNGKSAFI